MKLQKSILVGCAPFIGIFYSISLCANPEQGLERQEQLRSAPLEHSIKTADEALFESQLKQFERRVELLKKQRDKLPIGSTSYVQLDKDILEIETKLKGARADLLYYKGATPKAKERWHENVTADIAEIRTTLDRVLAE